MWWPVSRASGRCSRCRARQQAYNVDVPADLSHGQPDRPERTRGRAASDGVTRSRVRPPGVDPMSWSEDEPTGNSACTATLTFNPTPTLTVTAGASFDSIDDRHRPRRTRRIPRLGVTWRPTAHTTVRAAAFETLFGSLTTSTQNAQPRLEPVQVAGFTQLLFGGRGDRRSVRRRRDRAELSAEISSSVGRPTEQTRSGSGSHLSAQRRTRVLITLSERVQQGYLYWMPHERVSLSARYEHGRYRQRARASSSATTDHEYERLPLEIRYFARGGLTIGRARLARAARGRLPERPHLGRSILRRSHPARIASGLSTHSSVIAYRIAAASCL